MNAVLPIGLALSSCICLAHLFVIVVIYKARLRENRFFLIQLLSFSDLLFSVLTICAVAMKATKKETNESLQLVLSNAVPVFHVLSLQITMLITVDRYTAVRFGIHYPSMVTKTRLILAVVVAFAVNVTVAVIAVFYRTDYYYGTIFRVPSPLGMVIYIVIFRIVTSFSIVILGKSTIKIRDEKERNIKTNVLVHGEQAETLDILTTLKRGIKDVAVLNFWTCIFLIPLSVIGLSKLLGNEDRLIPSTNLFFVLAMSLSNPMVYIMSQSRIRGWLRRRFSNSVNAFDTNPV